jgi:hypothetical protein
VEEGHLTFFGDKSSPLIQARRIPTVGSKVSSWSVKIGCKRADWVGLFGAMVVGTASQQELLCGVVQCQTIIVVYGLSGLVER